MSDALNTPVRRPGREMHTDDVAMLNRPSIESREDLDREVVRAPKAIDKDYLDALAMAEEPVTIRIERSAEKFPAPVIDCWVNGKGAELLINGKWVETKAVPVGMPVTVKRKYVEVLVRARVDSIQTEVVERDNEDPRNFVHRSASQKAPLSILRDENPRAQEWLQNVMATA